MAVLKVFADVLQDFHEKKKNGALYVSVAVASENLIRFYFRDGEIYHLSYGATADRECLDILDCYDLDKAVYFDGMNSAVASSTLPRTRDLISAIRRTGKNVFID